jgi:phage tail-like protein
MPPVRTAAVSHVLLELDGVPCGPIHSVAGGSATADVIGEARPSPVAKKHLGPPRYEPLVLEAGFDLTRDLYEWIADSWAGKTMPRNGAVTMTDFNGKALARREFRDAFITSVTFPKLDASVQEAAFLRVELTPEITVDAKAGSVPKAVAERKTAMARNFSVEIDGLECRRVASVDAFTVRQPAARDGVGEREPVQMRGQTEFPSIRLQLSAGDADGWRSWFRSFVIDGKNTDADEKQGRITLLGPDLKDTIASVDLHNLGIFRLDDDWTTAASLAPGRMITVELYCESMSLSVGAPAPAGAPAAPVAG